MAESKTLKTTETIKDEEKNTEIRDEMNTRRKEDEEVEELAKDWWLMVEEERIALRVEEKDGKQYFVKDDNEAEDQKLWWTYEDLNADD